MNTMLICDDMEYMCYYFKSIFDELPDFSVVGCVQTKKDLLEQTKLLNPSVILLDIQMDTATTGVDVIPILKSLYPSTKI